MAFAVEPPRRSLRIAAQQTAASIASDGGPKTRTAPLLSRWCARAPPTRRAPSASAGSWGIRTRWMFSKQAPSPRTVNVAKHRRDLCIVNQADRRRAPTTTRAPVSGVSSISMSTGRPRCAASPIDNQVVHLTPLTFVQHEPLSICARSAQHNGPLLPATRQEADGSSALTPNASIGKNDCLQRFATFKASVFDSNHGRASGWRSTAVPGARDPTVGCRFRQARTPDSTPPVDLPSAVPDRNSACSTSLDRTIRVPYLEARGQLGFSLNPCPRKLGGAGLA